MTQESPRKGFVTQSKAGHSAWNSRAPCLWDCSEPLLPKLFVPAALAHRARAWGEEPQGSPINGGTEQQTKSFPQQLQRFKLCLHRNCCFHHYSTKTSLSECWWGWKCGDKWQRGSRRREVPAWCAHRVSVFTDRFTPPAA